MMTGDLALRLLQLPANPRTQEGIMFEQLDVINQPSRYAATDKRFYLVPSALSRSSPITV